jgi:tetratricopeptide (TPR) repeat protein
VTIERLLDAGRAMDAGELDRAEQIYRQVAEADPRSSIAVVGLARVALRRGEPEEALRLANDALSIDPANAAARRLVERDARATAEASGTPRADLDAAASADADEEWPWPDLDEQLARYRERRPGRLGRLLRRGGRD